MKLLAKTLQNLDWDTDSLFEKRKMMDVTFIGDCRLIVTLKDIGFGREMFSYDIIGDDVGGSLMLYSGNILIENGLVDTKENKEFLQLFSFFKNGATILDNKKLLTNDFRDKEPTYTDLKESILREVSHMEDEIIKRQEKELKEVSVLYTGLENRLRG